MLDCCHSMGTRGRCKAGRSVTVPVLIQQLSWPSQAISVRPASIIGNLGGIPELVSNGQAPRTPRVTARRLPVNCPCQWIHRCHFQSMVQHGRPFQTAKCMPSKLSQHWEDRMLFWTPAPKYQYGYLPRLHTGHVLAPQSPRANRGHVQFAWPTCCRPLVPFPPAHPKALRLTNGAPAAPIVSLHQPAAILA